MSTEKYNISANILNYYIYLIFRLKKEKLNHQSDELLV